MSKIYVFGIGGTGSRVLKALTMLLASGVKCSQTVVPIIVDPDAANADVTRTVDVIRKYVNIRKKLEWTAESRNHFFGTEIAPIEPKDANPSFRLSLDGTKDKKFSEFIEIDSMDNSNKAMMRMLFSENNLSAEMEVGFKGNPNIGSVVLNQFTFSEEFDSFAQKFEAGDKIFIINSIFGGTGASGYPLLLKTLRSNDTMSNYNLINNAPIGAVTVLPYFDVINNPESAIDSGTFISKTRSALSYYNRGITGNNSIDIQYYIGDKTKDAYANNEGGQSQKNKAHFVELASALAVIDFAENGEHTTDSMTKEFGIKSDHEEMIFNDLSNVTNDLLRISLSQFTFFCRYIFEEFNDSHKKQPWVENNKLYGTFRGKQFYQDLLRFLTEFKSWMEEMKDNKVSFAPVRFSGEWSTTINGLQVNNGWGFKFDSYSLDGKMNTASRNLVDSTIEQTFMELFYIGTKEILKDKYKF